MGASLETSKTLDAFCYHLALIWQNPEVIINMSNYSAKYSEDE